MNTQTLTELIRNGESSVVEFKTETARPDSLAAEMVSLANLDGGVVLVGVADDGTVEGCARSDIEEFIVNICRNNIRPAILPRIERVLIDSKAVYAVTVERGSTPHATSTGMYYIRVGSTRQIPTQQELLRLFQRRNLLQYDETPVVGASIRDLSLTAINRYLDRLGQSEIADTEPASLSRELVNLSVAMEDENGIHPTLAGILLFGKNPQRLFPSFRVLCGAYRGASVDTTAVAEKTIDGTLDEQIEGTIAFLRQTMPQDTDLRRQLQRPDGFLFPVEALREAVVNALAHRDYAIMGSSVRVNLFAGALEIRSPGNLPNTLSLESMRYRQFARNQTIVSFLTGLGYMERRGKGVLRMLRAAEEHALSCSILLTPDKQELVVRFDKNSQGKTAA